MNLIEPNRKPILIISTPRTGSTALLHTMVEKYGYKNWFSEPDYTPNLHNIDDFHNFFDNSKDFIVKIHALNLKKYRPDVQDYLKSSPDPYRIKIQRRDIIAQIVSLYILRITNKLHTRPWEKQKEFYVTIDDKKIIDTIQTITEHLNYYQTNFNSVDQILYYEDLLLTDSMVIKNLQPTNYDVLYKTVQDLVNN